MIVSPPLLSNHQSGEHDDQWIDRCMTGDAPGRGAYPLSHEQEWHGGLHLTAPRNGVKVADICAIADGKVVFLRAPTEVDKKLEHHPLNYSDGHTSDGCIVIEHTFDICKGPNASFTIYSVYQHVTTLSQKLALNKQVHRRDPIALAGYIYGEQDRFHFEICCDDSNLQKLVGRGGGKVSTAADGRCDVVFGEIYFVIPAGTSVYSDEPSPCHCDGRPVEVKKPSAPSSSEAAKPAPILTTASEMIVGWRHGSGIGSAPGGGGFTAYRKDGSVIAALSDARPEYELYKDARAIVTAWERSKANTPSEFQQIPAFDAICELLRFGRVIHPDDVRLTPANAAHWRKIPYDGGEGWVNLNAANVRMFSDADFPHWRGWALIDDDSVAADCKCDSAMIKQILDAAGQGGNDLRKPDKALQLPEIRKQLSRAICKFPSEWEAATLEARWSWMKQKTERNPTPYQDDEYKALVDHLTALCFDCPSLFAAQWRFDPREFIKMFRRCGWSSIAHRISHAIAKGCLPASDGLSKDLKADLYVRMLLESADHLKSGAIPFSCDVRASFSQGEAIEFGLRIPTDPSARGGRGELDDMITVLQNRQADAFEIIAETLFTADPAGSYQEGPPRPSYWGVGRGGAAAPSQPDTPDANGDGVNDLGRIHEGIFTFRWGQHTHKGSNVYTNDAGRSFNVLEPTSKLPSDRYFNSAWHFDEHSFLTVANSPYKDNYTFLQHTGYPNFTGSAGCQTFPFDSDPSKAHLSFRDFARKIGATKQHSFIYVLRNL